MHTQMHVSHQPIRGPTSRHIYWWPSRGQCPERGCITLGEGQAPQRGLRRRTSEGRGAPSFEVCPGGETTGRSHCCPKIQGTFTETRASEIALIRVGGRLEVKNPTAPFRKKRAPTGPAAPCTPRRISAATRLGDGVGEGRVPAPGAATHASGPGHCAVHCTANPPRTRFRAGGVGGGRPGLVPGNSARRDARRTLRRTRRPLERASPADPLRRSGAAEGRGEGGTAGDCTRRWGAVGRGRGRRPRFGAMGLGSNGEAHIYGGTADPAGAPHIYTCEGRASAEVIPGTISLDF